MAYLQSILSMSQSSITEGNEDALGLAACQSLLWKASRLCTAA